MEQKEYEYCLRCGRKLRSQESRTVGYGNICLRKSRENPYYKRLFPVFTKDDKK